MTAALVNHLWQSTLFAIAAWMLTLALRDNEARIRYWIWFAASAKFLVPFSLLIALGSRLSQQVAVTPGSMSESIVVALHQLTQPMDTSLTPQAENATGASVSLFLMTLWALGCSALLARWLILWLRIRAEVHAASPCDIEAPLAMKTSSTQCEPGVVGIFNPVLLLPAGIAAQLTAQQLRAVIAHELSHVRYRDNLTAAIHMLVQALFWFHPAVWWIGARLIDEREQACDEAALQAGGDPESYAAGILKVCQFYVESRLACVAGATGADLKRRIRKIMSQRNADDLSVTRKLLLTGVLCATVATPVIAGMNLPPPVSPGAAAPWNFRFDAASIRLTPSVRHGEWPVARSGSLLMHNVSLRELIAFAYDTDRVGGGPQWIDSPRYDIEATPGASDNRKEVDESATYRPLIRQLLAERFNLVRALTDFAFNNIRDNVWMPRCRACSSKLQRAADVRVAIKEQRMLIENLRRIGASLDPSPRGLEFFLPRQQASPDEKLKEAEERLTVLEDRLRVYESIEAAHLIDFNQITASAVLSPARR